MRDIFLDAFFNKLRSTSVTMSVRHLWLIWPWSRKRKVPAENWVLITSITNVRLINIRSLLLQMSSPFVENIWVVFSSFFFVNSWCVASNWMYQNLFNHLYRFHFHSSHPLEFELQFPWLTNRQAQTGFCLK